MIPSQQELLAFLRKAHASTYAAGDRNRVANPSRPGSIEYRYEEGPFVYQDIYFGNRTFTGKEVVYYDGKPVWAMNYHGSLAPQIEKSVGFGFLRRALLEGVKTGEFLRGPRSWTEGELEYTCRYENWWSSFSGEEHIYRKTTNYHGGVYHCVFHGGIIEE